MRGAFTALCAGCVASHSVIFSVVVNAICVWLGINVRNEGIGSLAAFACFPVRDESEGLCV